MYIVNITDTAHNDLQNAALYIANALNNKSAANRLLDTADRELSSLSDFPERNPLVQDSFLSRNGIRMQMINNYLAFYIVHTKEKTVTILRIIHSRRDWISILKSDAESLRKSKRNEGKDNEQKL